VVWQTRDFEVTFELRGSPQAAILRVYTACCGTPVAHVPSAKMAFVGIPHLFMRAEGA
jgi:hypothetical protein